MKLRRQLPDVVKTLAGLFGAKPGRTPGPVQPRLLRAEDPLNKHITGERGFAAL